MHEPWREKLWYVQARLRATSPSTWAERRPGYTAAHAGPRCQLDGGAPYPVIRRFRQQLTVLAEALDADLQPPAGAIAAIKAEPALAGMELIRQSRLSVSPVRDEEWRRILEMGS